MLKEFKDLIIGSSSSSIRLYFITRKYKNNLKNKRAKVLDKYDFKVYSVNSNEDVKNHLYEVLKSQVSKIIEKNYDVVEFDVISDDTKKIFTYDMFNKDVSFKDVVNNQLNSKSSLEKFRGTDFFDKKKEETLWAYCIAFYDEQDNWYYAFKKILKNKVATNTGDNPERNIISRSLRTRFNDSSERLETLKTETITLDSFIDCFFKNDKFYVIHKSNFEKIINLEEEYKSSATEMVEELKKENRVYGADILQKILESNPKYHKKLVKIKKLGVYEKLEDPVIFSNIKNIAKSLNLSLKTKDDKLVIENESDVENVVKFLCEYFKKSPVTGKMFGTYSGSEM